MRKISRDLDRYKKALNEKEGNDRRDDKTLKM